MVPYALQSDSIYFNPLPGIKQVLTVFNDIFSMLTLCIRETPKWALLQTVTSETLPC